MGYPAIADLHPTIESCWGCSKTWGEGHHDGCRGAVRLPSQQTAVRDSTYGQSLITEIARLRVRHDALIRALQANGLCPAADAPLELREAFEAALRQYIEPFETVDWTDLRKACANDAGVNARLRALLKEARGFVGHGGPGFSELLARIDAELEE